MFRRKEEGLFDTDVLDRPEDIESINVVTPSSYTPAPSAPSVQQTSSAAVNTTSTGQQPQARPAVPPATPSLSSATPFRPATSPSTTNSMAQPMNDITRARAPEAKPVVPVVNNVPPANKSGTRVLTVGNDILLKGEIATCDRLVIQGKVEATLNDVHTVELAEIGSFKGTANVVDAQISGTFDGDLVCTGKLIIFASGKVRGKITYGEIEIERGGEISGEIKTVSSAQNSKAVRKEAA